MMQKVGESQESPMHEDMDVQREIAPRTINFVGAAPNDDFQFSNEKFENESVHSNDPSIERPISAVKTNHESFGFKDIEPVQDEKQDEVFYENETPRMDGKIYELVLLR